MTTAAPVADVPVGILEALGDPRFYPHRPASVEQIETHASRVFLAGDRVYKVKRPVAFPFLDYSTLERRRLMCEEEVRLGRRLAPRLYLGVRPIVRRGNGLALGHGGDPHVVEYAVELRRFPEERTLASVLRRGEPVSEVVIALGRRLAAFHAAAEPAPGRFGPVDVTATVDDNFETLLRFVPHVGDSAVAGGHRFALAFIHGHRELIRRRSLSGCVRDGHGDLRCEHVILEDGVEIFDPVEFDPALRRIDVAADLAFLVMDLVDAGRDDLAQLLVGGYRDAGGDCGDDRLIAFYAAYRAWVRAKVAMLRADQLPADDRRGGSALAEAARLAALGGRFAWRARRPMVLVVCGGAATGKTTLARAVAAVAALPHLSSDPTRKALAGLAPTARAAARHYSERVGLQTYAALGAQAAEAVAGGSGAVVDATFRRRADRAAFARALGELGPGATAVYVECRAPARVVIERAARRLAEGTSVSDAGPELAVRQLREFEPLDEIPADRHLALRTDAPVDELIDDVEAGLDARIARGGLT